MAGLLRLNAKGRREGSHRQADDGWSLSPTATSRLYQARTGHGRAYPTDPHACDSRATIRYQTGVAENRIGGFDQGQIRRVD